MFGFFKEKRANKSEDKNSYESYYKNKVEVKVRISSVAIEAIRLVAPSGGKRPFVR